MKIDDLDFLYRTTTKAEVHEPATMAHFHFHNACYQAWPAIKALIEAAYENRKFKGGVSNPDFPEIEYALKHLDSL